jgi:hypothetical protein
MNSNNSNRQASAATVARSHGAKNSEVARIAKKIVQFVKRTDGPVLLHEIGEHVPGFKAPGTEGYIYFISFNGKETVYWAGMTKAGVEALGLVLRERRVAVQFVSRLLYLFDGVEINDKAWEPIALVPVRGANIDTPKLAARVSPVARDLFLSSGKRDFRPLTPRPMRFTADGFSTL